MQADKPYRQGHAEALLLPCDEGSCWVIDERGVWPAAGDYKEAERLGLVPEYEVLSWKPTMAFKDDQNAPDCKDTPALPFPFDARDLAAFMLAGVGAVVADFYGDWGDGPERESLDDIDPSDNYARRAVREAFDAYREAKRAIGCQDGESPAADAMVLELLKPTSPVQPKAEPAAAVSLPAQQAAAPAPVAGSAGNALDAQKIPMKKAALIAVLEHEWESIEADLSEATRNGLKDAAHAGKHGEWYESKARAWAVSKGKIRQAVQAIHPAMWPGTVMRNRT